MKVTKNIFYVTTIIGVLLLITGIVLIALYDPDPNNETKLEILGTEIQSNNLGLVLCIVGVVFMATIFKEIIGKGAEKITPDNALRMTEAKMSENLKNVLSLAEMLSKRDGKERTSTRYFFKAILILRPKNLSKVLEVLEANGAMPTTNEDEAFLKDQPLTMDVNRPISYCITDSLNQLSKSTPKSEEIDESDVFIDVARFGRGASVKKLRDHGISKAKIEAMADELEVKVHQRR